jgi:hypothetical protein
MHTVRALAALQHAFICGSAACQVMMCFVTLQDILLMVGPYGDWVKYSLEEPVHLVTECDGVRTRLTNVFIWHLCAS